MKVFQQTITEWFSGRQSNKLVNSNNANDDDDNIVTVISSPVISQRQCLKVGMIINSSNSNSKTNHCEPVWPSGKTKQEW